MDDPYNQIPDDQLTPANNQFYQQDRHMSLVSELDPQKHLKSLLEHFRGRLWDENEKRYIDIEGVQPLMNQYGRNAFFHYATPFLNPVTTMSNFTKDINRIHMIVKMQVNDASKHFHLHWREYGIQKKTHIKIITNHLMILGISSLYKAIGAGDRKAATSNISETISNITKSESEKEGEQKKKGLFNWRFK